MKNILIVIFLLLAANSGFSQKKTTTIEGNISFIDRDSLTIRVWNYGRFPGALNESELFKDYKLPIINHHFELTLWDLANRPYQFNLTLPIKVVRQLYHGPLSFADGFLDQGDHLNYHISDKDYDVTGVGALKIKIMKTFTKSPKSINGGIDLYNEMIEQGYQDMKSFLVTIEGNKQLLSKIDFKLISIKAQLYFTGWPRAFIYYNRDSTNRQLIREDLLRTYKPLIENNKMPIDSALALYDSSYQRYIEDRSYLDEIMNGDFEYLSDSIRNEYIFLKTNYHGRLREKLVTYLLLDNPGSPDIAFCCKDALTYFQNGPFKKIIITHCSQIPGMPAYNFALLDSNNVTHRLNDYKGKVVVLDFWYTGCGNCIHLNPKLKLVEDHFKDNANVVFISISSDKSEDLWKQSIKSGLYTSTSEINLRTDGKGDQDPYFQATNIYSFPALKLIDKNGLWGDNPIDCRDDDGKDLINKIEKSLTN